MNHYEIVIDTSLLLGDDNYETPTNEYIPQPRGENTHLPDLSFIDLEETYGDVLDASTQETEGDIPVETVQQIHGRLGRQTTRATPYSVGWGRK